MLLNASTSGLGKVHRNIFLSTLILIVVSTVVASDCVSVTRGTNQSIDLKVIHRQGFVI